MAYFRSNKGFSLIEILVVLGLLTIIFSTFFYFWNSSQAFKKVRDSRRMNDLQAIDMAIKNLIINYSDIYLGEENIIYISLPDATSTCNSYNLTQVYSPFSYRCRASTTYLNVDGSGWLPINFVSGSVMMLSSLPRDPLNNSSYFYSYQTRAGRYKLSARLEDPIFLEEMIRDGGLEPTLYEVGNDLRIPSPQSGLVLYLPLNEGTGTIAYDLSGYNNNGILYSSSTICSDPPTSGCPQWIDGKVGKALKFDGLDDYLYKDVINGSPKSYLTICSWIRTSMSSAAYMLQLNRSPSNYFNELMFAIDSGRLQFIDYSTSTYGFSLAQKSIKTINNNNWRFVCFVKSNTVGLYYIDGDFDSQVSASINVQYGANDFAIGKDYRDNNKLFNGFLDEIRIYNRSLSQSEIKTIYEATK
ncbi:MAG: prepilin-type N-terminal cleavage/methylation domain-containing protein [Patescibacteria group bacterium]|nr:prepilin-type N-terminal cleavage/methylation domain-containing protein [Patescibacteria group bacterium]